VTKAWVIDKLRENAEKAFALPHGSAVANHALELLGKELGTFRDDQPHRQVRLEDLSTEDLKRLLGDEPDGGVASTVEPADASASKVQ
jgi:hypothetical protein